MKHYDQKLYLTELLIQIMDRIMERVWEAMGRFWMGVELLME
jgi:hypothetical protein